MWSEIISAGNWVTQCCQSYFGILTRALFNTLMCASQNKLDDWMEPLKIVEGTKLEHQSLLRLPGHLVLRTPLEPGVRVGKEFINQDETRVLSPLLTTYIYFVTSILHYIIDLCLPLTATSSPQVFLHLLCHYSVIERRRTVTLGAVSTQMSIDDWGESFWEETEEKVRV